MVYPKVMCTELRFTHILCIHFVYLHFMKAGTFCVMASGIFGYYGDLCLLMGNIETDMY